MDVCTLPSSKTKQRAKESSLLHWNERMHPAMLSGHSMRCSEDLLLVLACRSTGHRPTTSTCLSTRVLSG